jgi:hypothetical protein
MNDQRARVSSRWQNLTLAAAMLLIMAEGVLLSLIMLSHPLLKVVGALASVGMFGWLAIRARRMGVYVDPGATITARSLTTTRSFPFADVIRTTVYHGHGSGFRRFYAPAIVVRRDHDKTTEVRLWWLASATEEPAREREAEVRAVVAPGALSWGHTLSIDPHGWSLGRWGTLLLDGWDTLEVLNPHGGRRSLDMLPQGMVGIRGWLDEKAGLLVLGGERCDRVVVLDLNFDEVIESVALQRDPDVGLRTMRFFAVPPALLGCLTESALFALDGAGKLCWYWAHDDLTLTLDEVRHGAIFLTGLDTNLDHTITRRIDAATGRVLGMHVMPPT